MLIFVAIAFTVAGLCSRSIRATLGALFWASLVVTLITLYGMTA